MRWFSSRLGVCVLLPLLFTGPVFAQQRSSQIPQPGRNAPSSLAVAASQRPSDADDRRPSAQQREIQADDPEDEERLNRELWESIKKTPYEAMRERVARTQREAGPKAGDIVLPTGWKLAPAGATVGVGRLPYEAIAYAGRIVVLDTGYYYGQDQPEVSLVDPDANRVAQTLRFPALFPSAVVGADGDLYLSGGFSKKVYRLNSRFESVTSYDVAGYAGPVASLDATHLIVATLVAADTADAFDKGQYRQGRLAILNTQTGKVENEVPTGYFPYALRLANGKLYVAVLGENKIQVLTPQLQLQTAIPVGRSPQALAWQDGSLYVVNANDDTISVIDTGLDRVTDTISLRGDRTRYGGAPTSCQVDGDRLYVSLANVNAVAVLDRRSHRRLGEIPTGWYPTKVLLDQKRL
jgi:YVTN family beta-propeller protein